MIRQYLVSFLSGLLIGTLSLVSSDASTYLSPIEMPVPQNSPALTSTKDSQKPACDVIMLDPSDPSKPVKQKVDSDPAKNDVVYEHWTHSV